MRFTEENILNVQDTIWQTSELTKAYLKGVRGAIPLANEQIDLMLRLAKAAQPQAKTILDLGCGDGILGQALLEQYPEATAVFVDFSEPMLEAARQRLRNRENVIFVQGDYGKHGWQNRLEKIVNGQLSMVNCQFDVIVSGYSIHHQPDTRKKEVYAELHDLLTPGGIFLNIEHVASRTPWIQQQFDELFIDHLVVYAKKVQMGKNREQVAQEFYYRPDKAANILASVEDQCNWLREIGFEQVDCYLKIFELAVFGGVKKERG
ncbi:MAG: class I SAM-dependent methyltransferase [Chloroflexi bacterium]|nr:MAG: class I SAM-dependent methyltransferase [Chloroflexota bacterium]